MEGHNLIMSASGWRKIFTASGEENDTSPDIGLQNRLVAAVAAETFADYILSRTQNPFVVLGIDTRPTGPQIADTMLRIFMAKKIAVSYAGIIAAPEIMAYSHTADAFVYISASHNPIGHNGIKFGLNDGGVLGAEENRALSVEFEKRWQNEDEEAKVQDLASKCHDVDLDWVFTESVAVMREATSVYRSFAKTTISGTENISRQNKFFAEIRRSVLDERLGVVCDMNGSARTLSIDADFFKECGISFHAINNRPGQIAHAIIPEPENLVYVASELEKLQAAGKREFLLGYMPDCDGDRGNIVFWNEKTQRAEMLRAQEVFALSVLSELAFSVYLKLDDSNDNSNSAMKIANYFKTRQSSPSPFAVVANCPTSMRIEEIASAFGAKVFRAEVGEANCVNLAREKRAEGYTVRILGEGSNGGNITHPSAVRDPLNTLFALIKLLVVRDSEDDEGRVKLGLFHLWCEASGQKEKYREDFSLTDVIASLPQYTTTGVSERRAILKVNSKNHAELKSRFQKIFEKQWSLQKEKLREKYGFESYEVFATNGTHEEKGLTDFSKSGTGGLKITFRGANEQSLAFIWMRGSGTESVFRVLSDVKGTGIEATEEEKKLLEWETKMILKADGQI